MTAGASTPARAAPDTQPSLRDLLLVLADSKRLLGMRYAEWILGAPELEAGIACASMAQDEWGHARLLYALLKDFGDEPETLEHGREPAQYRNIEALDETPSDWPGLIALNALIDPALSAQMDALRGSAWMPVRQRVEKMLEEEAFHAAHGAAWFRRLAAARGPARDALAAAVDRLLPVALRWFGPDSARAEALAGSGIVDAAGDSLRARYLERVAPQLAALGVDAPEPDFGGFDEATRRVSRSGPDQITVARIRGDRNRAFLMD